VLTIAERTISKQPSNFCENSTPSVGIYASDNELIDAIAGGDRHAMRLLYGRHSVRVYRFALRFTADEAMAEDLVNEVFLNVWRKAGTFQGRSKVSTWLLGIARNKALEIARRHSHESWDDGACEAVEDEADDPETAMQKKESSSLLFECLANLSPAHREIIDLVYYHEKSVDEVAEIIHIPPSTVKTRMFYARNHLAKTLVKAGFYRHQPVTRSATAAGIRNSAICSALA